MFDRILVSCIVVLCIASGCRTTPGVHEVQDTDGFPLRLEVEATAEAELDAALIQARMNDYRARKGVTPQASGRRPTAAEAEEFDPFIERGCPPQGAATTEAKMASNRLKNRIQIPQAADFDPGVSLDALREPGNDEDRWSTALAGTIEGYVRKAKGTGKESCNCKASSRRLTDTHLDIVAGPDDEEFPVIAEITPPMRLIHEHLGLEDWSSAAIRSRYEGKRVRISGWLFFDDSHITGSENTDPGDWRGESPNWRATAWEIHPITHIELLESP